ncbi:MAG: long-chain fatty acid--CoA ligase [Bacteroidales bacterium]|nr:long-chain fatty acid--CoA ligase [Bacteroidales bacterium]
MNNVTRLFDLLPHIRDTYTKKDDLFAGKKAGVWVKYTIDDYIAISTQVSYGLMALGVKKGDKVATISGSRPEWNFVDMGILQMGAIHIPVYPTISESDYRYILAHAEVQYVFVSGWDTYRKIEHIISEIPTLKGVYAFRETEGIPMFSEVVSLGKANVEEQKLENIKSSILPTDLATIIYTSGTTGNPKGVMLSHLNIISNFMACKHILPFGDEGKALSYLPLCHVYERMLTYLYQYAGISIYYAESIATISDNMREMKPYILSTVPRLLEKIYDKIMANGLKLKGIKRMIFFWAVHLGLKYEMYGKNGFFYEAKLKIARKLVFSKWSAALGGNLKVMVSGGAALQPRLARIFWAAGIPVLEGYGLTETSPVISVNNFEENGVKFGTVGPVISNVQVEIAPDQEIICKGPSLMMGYYKEPEITSAAIDSNGWFHTGDLGRIEPEGQLKITGRKKEIFKTSFGKYISPELIENKFKESHFIDALIVVGENQKYAAALIVPDFAFLKSWCARKEIPYTTDTEMVQNERIQNRVGKEISKFNKFFGATEQIKAFDILDKEWTVETGELTASLKLRRLFIQEKYGTRIDRLFNRVED